MSIQCSHCSLDRPASEHRLGVIKFGHFLRKSDHTQVFRYFCKDCNRTFSEATASDLVYQKKRHLNSSVFTLLASGVSQRRLAFLLKINRKTVIRKFLLLGTIAYQQLTELHSLYPKVESFEFDDLETFEHSKLKPLSVVMAVEHGTRRILGFRVASMGAKGLLVKKSLKKYGKRKDERSQARKSLFKELKPHVIPNATIKSDENPYYKKTVKSFFPKATHEVYKGRRGCVVGQGELKAGGFDPIFSLNHTYAMLRANINRLFRRTWNTTKKKERLALHIAMYSIYHNLFLLKNKAR